MNSKSVKITSTNNITPSVFSIKSMQYNFMQMLKALARIYCMNIITTHLINLKVSLYFHNEFITLTIMSPHNSNTYATFRIRTDISPNIPARLFKSLNGKLQIVQLQSICQEGQSLLLPFHFSTLKVSFFFIFSYPWNGTESIAFGSNFRNRDFDGFTRYVGP